MSSTKSAAKQPAAASPKKTTTKRTPAKATALVPADTLFYDPQPKRLRVFRLDGRTWLLGDDLMLLATGVLGNSVNICADPEDWRFEVVELEESGKTRQIRARLISLWGAHEYCVRLFTERSYALWRWIRRIIGEEAGA